MRYDDSAPAIVRRVEARRELAFVCDENGTVLDVSAAAVEVLGEPSSAVRGRPFAQFTASDDGDAVNAGLTEARRAGTSTFAVRLRTANGGAVPVELAAWALDARGMRLVVCVALASGEVRREAEERARRLADTQKVIATILEVALQEGPLEGLLQAALDLILWIPWLSIERRGAILLVDDDPNTLVMKVSRGLDGPLLSSCGRVPFGTCLCGQAAASQAPVYAADLDERHTRRHAGMLPHGHYCVPICGGGTTLGVINTYLAAGHEASAIDLEFLMAVADTLAGVIVRHRVAAECEALRRRLQDAQRQGTAEAAVADAAREVSGLMNVFLASARELLADLPPTGRLRGAAEEIEQAARRGMGLASELDASGRRRSSRGETRCRSTTRASARRRRSP